jgi:hypothetical protein
VVNGHIKNGLREFLRILAERGFRLLLRFTLSDGEGRLLREFRIHKDGLEQGLPSGKKLPYVFPLMALARSADGRAARVRLFAEEAERVEFLN